MKQILERLPAWSVRGVLTALLLVAAGCTAAGPQMGATGGATGGTVEGDDTAAVPTVTPGEVTVVNMRSNATPPGAANGSAYFTILNGTDETVHFVSVESGVAERVELHETVNDNGVLRMTAQPDGFKIAPGESLVLEPGSKHVMLLGLSEPLAEDGTYELTLHFARMDPMHFSVPVIAIGAQTVDHGDIDHGEMAPTDEVVEQPAWATEFEVLDVSRLHHIDDSLNITGTLDAEFVGTIQTFQTGLTGIEWPEELNAQVSALDAALSDLAAALQSEEMEAAGPLATDVQEIAHDLQQSIEAHLSGEEHDAHDDGASEGEDHVEGAHEDGEHEDGEHNAESGE